MLGYKVGKNMSEWLSGWAFDPLVVMPIVFVFLLFVVDAYDPETLSNGLAMVVATSPIWLPLYLGVFFWVSWIDYIRFMYWFGLDFVVLEVQLPQTVDKNPMAIEMFLATFHNAGGETTFIARVWKGSFRPLWSLEIASNEGRIGYYMHMRRAFRNIVEARLYGQFPEAKVVEVDDYATQVPFNQEEYTIFGGEYRKGALGALPIKTYIDYGLDKDPKEEFKIDPITSILELFSQVGKNEHFWLQIILKARRNESEWYGFRNKANDNFRNPAKKEVKKLIKAAAERAGELVTDESAKKSIASRGITLLSEGEKARVEAIERSLSKLTFECGIRVVYIAKKDNFAGINAGAIIRFFDAFKGQDADREYNALGITGGTTIFDYPWQDFMDIRLKILCDNLYFQYKNRAYFYVPYDQVPVFMTTEEIATLWHFPSSIIQTPGLNRVPSRRSEAPINLPTGL